MKAFISVNALKCKHRCIEYRNIKPEGNSYLIHHESQISESRAGTSEDDLLGVYHHVNDMSGLDQISHQALYTHIQLLRVHAALQLAQLQKAEP